MSPGNPSSPGLPGGPGGPGGPFKSPIFSRFPGDPLFPLTPGGPCIPGGPVEMIVTVVDFHMHNKLLIILVYTLNNTLNLLYEVL